MPAVNKAIDDFRSKNPNFKLPASSFMLAGLEARVQDALTIKKGSFCCPLSFFSNLSDFLSAPIPAANLRPEKIKKTKGSVNSFSFYHPFLIISPSFTPRRANVPVSLKKQSITPTKRTVLSRLTLRLLRIFHPFLPNPWIPALLPVTPYVTRLIFAFC